MCLFELIILGAGSATPVLNRFPSAQILNYNGNLSLIDCGEGTQWQLLKYKIKTSKINQIFISHLHGDHYLGLMGLLSTINFQDRKNPINLFAPHGLKEIIELQIKISDLKLAFEIVFHQTNPKQFEQIAAYEHLNVFTIPLKHRIDCTGFLFVEKNDQRTLDKQKIEGLNLQPNQLKALKQGNDIALNQQKTIENKDLTTLKHNHRTYAYISDTIFDPTMATHIQNIDLLYHEATFMNELTQRAAKTHHSTAAQAAQIAQTANAKKLLIGHFSSRYLDLKPLLDEAKIHFENTQLATEGQTYTI